jgi:hypothetical protein
MLLDRWGHATHNLLLLVQPVREIIKPENQLRLTDVELNEEVAKMLTANNPAAPKCVDQSAPSSMSCQQCPAHATQLHNHASSA